jgi:hypothetical protein
MPVMRTRTQTVPLKHGNLILVHRLMLAIVEIGDVILRLITVTLQDGETAASAKSQGGNLRKR